MPARAKSPRSAAREQEGWRAPGRIGSWIRDGDRSKGRPRGAKNSDTSSLLLPGHTGQRWRLKRPSFLLAAEDNVPSLGLWLNHALPDVHALVQPGQGARG